LPVNRTLPAPWDFNTVLVLAPLDEAGLADFLKQAQRLDEEGICHFTFAHSRFEGADAAREMQAALHAALEQSASKRVTPDVVVLLGVAGPACDRAWRDDADLARYLGALPMPVWTGIEDEPAHDSPLLDTVVHTRFESPAALMAQLQQVISQRLAEAKASFEQITTLAASALQAAKARARALDLGVRAQAQRQLAQRQQSADDLMNTIRHAARLAPQPDPGMRLAGPPL
jgi:exodeoxyribonuclease VII large subunit